MPDTTINTPKANKSVNINMCRLVSGKTPDPKHTLAGLNLINLIKSIEIYEDIFTTSLSGSITFQDKYSLSTIFELDGSEDLHLAFSVYNPSTGKYREYGTSDAPIVFSMYAQQNRIPVTKGTEQFEIKLVSAEVYGANEYKISKTYKNTFIEDIIQDIIRNGLSSTKPFVHIDKTKTPITMTIPFLTPLQAIKLLCMHGQSEQQETNYLFFETLNGFEFRSLRSLIRDASKKNIPTISQTLSGTRLGRDTDSYLTADTIELISGYDMLYPMMHGYFSSTTYAVDILAGVCKKTISKISAPEYRNRPLLNGVAGTEAMPIYPFVFGDLVNPTSKIFLVPTTEFSYKTSTLREKDLYIHDNMIAQTLDGRNRELISLQLRSLRAVVSGAPELHAGDIVNIEYPSSREIDGKKSKDIASGKYLIVSAKHTIINNGYGEFLYETAIEAGTDSTPIK